MTDLIRIAVVGLGKIAQDAHLPAIARSDEFELAFLVDPRFKADGPIPAFQSLDAALTAGVPFDAIALCTPPQSRLELCEQLLETSCAILPSTARIFSERARKAGIPIFAAWHSRFSSQMPAAIAWARHHPLKRGVIEWRENASKWHPGQGWLWQPGGFGVFDPGINALSILTALYDSNWAVSDVHFRTPENFHTPISADFTLSARGAKVDVCLEFHTSSEEVWSIRLEAVNGEVFELTEGGAAISVGGGPIKGADTSEYDALYRHFAKLVRHRQTDFDISPLEIASEAFLRARHTPIAPMSI